MARTPKGPIPVDSIRHTDTRPNIPTADGAPHFYDEESDSREPLEYVRYAGLAAERAARDETLDPQLVWRGKDEQDDENLLVDAPPIYIQEKIDPRVLIENLRKTAAAGEPEPEFTLFDTFDGLDELSAVEYYQHEAKWANRMILGDSLQVMGSLAEREQLRGKVQMIYIDPPYGIKFGSNWQVSARTRDVKDGNLADAAREAEQIKAFRDTWEAGIHSYLSYLRDRLVVARELLTESGSVFVQIGDENVHLVRSLLDEVFGSVNWITSIAVTKTSSATGDFLGGTTDYVHWFAKNRDRVKYRNLLRVKSAGGDGADMYTRLQLSDGSSRTATAEERAGISKPPGGARFFRHDNLTSQSMGREKGEGAASWFPIQLDGREYRPSMQARWKTNETGMRRLLLAGRVAPGRSMPAYVRFLDDFPAFPYTEIWSDVGGARDKSYVVETAPTIIQRCMLMCTDPGDLVLDPTCGSGTTAYVAEQWGRRWITIDTSRVALALARQRIMGAKYPFYLLTDSPEGRTKEQELAGKLLPPADTNSDIRHGFVYERVQHVTLKSIANNPDIREGMTRDEIDKAIKRYADFELLYDKPYEDKSKVRVSGPFTVESLSPHRSLSFDDSDAFREQPTETDDRSFEQSVLDNLLKAGIQNGRRAERLQFASIEAYPGQYIQAIGESTDNHSDDETLRVAISLGPQYGTVSPGYIKRAAKEAIDAGIGLVAVLGFAFDPQATGVTEADGITVVDDDGFATVERERKLGRTQVLLVRMNSDLLMGEELKKTGAGNLFTVFGEPDIALDETDEGRLQVTLRGVDVYDPTLQKTRSAGVDRIALWMIDTDYNEESFFVRQCYFTGGNDPYKRLRTALKAEIDADAWASLYRDVSIPFDKPSTGKIAVKVINDYGDEVMKVIEVG
ncbi:site-specific DNA-methyltransferase [Agromyces intestinalis]|uniref:Site-specific DNA-methyltransferase n=1 Tax=Agromyces intestinalis TaxID=2592652 RepID=A0A5C1YKI8_9MICO|nr:site-specific DNA-methyltransferase [Agromyces intestinalis]QEO15597.1 site-specific DNA-methyltransferase [Agromyces intestinalis]